MFLHSHKDVVDTHQSPSHSSFQSNPLDRSRSSHWNDPGGRGSRVIHCYFNQWSEITVQLLVHSHWMILQEEFQSHANYHFSQWSVSAEQLLFCWWYIMQLSLNSYILLCMLLHCCMDPRYTHQFQYGSPCPPIQPHKGRHSRSLDPAELSRDTTFSVHGALYVS